MDADMGDDYKKWAGSVSNVRVELPPPFHGDGQKLFAMWIQQFEAVARAQTRGASYVATLNILPTRLDGAALLQIYKVITKV